MDENKLDQFRRGDGLSLFGAECNKIFDDFLLILEPLLQRECALPQGGIVFQFQLELLYCFQTHHDLCFFGKQIPHSPEKANNSRQKA